MFDQAALDSLRANLGRLPSERLDFANSLLASATRWRTLSEKQWLWVKRLNEIAAHPEERSVRVAPDFGPVVALFNAAMAHTAGERRGLKHPKIELRLPDGRTLALSLGTGRYPGSVNVVVDGEWHGRVSPAGVWDKSGAADAATVALVLPLLQQMAADPIGTAAAHGRLTGRCSFCRIRLTDDRSVDAGYGPICAQNWGLPWGGHGEAAA